MNNVHQFLALSAAALLLVGPASLAGQPIQMERSVIASSGNHNTGGGLMLTATVGDLVISTAVTQSGTIILTQGYQQGAKLPVGLEKVERWVLKYSIFPNPTHEILSVDLEVNRPADLQFRMYDMLGKETNLPVERHRVMGAYRFQMNLSGLPEGRYLLVMQDGRGHTLKTLKIEKID